MKTKTIAAMAAFSLLPVAGFAQSPATPPVPPSAPMPPIPPNPPKDRHRDQDKGPKVPVTFLGVETSEVPRVLSEQLGLARGFGLVVDYVVPDAPAAAAGVQQNDILKMLNDQILMQPDQLAKLIRSYAEGTDVTLTILRKGQEVKLTVKLGKKEVSERRVLFGPDFKKRWKGHDNDLGFNFDFENLPDWKELTEELGPSIRDVVKDAHREAMRASSEARREAMRATREATREARREAKEAIEEARRAAKELRVFSSDDGAMKATTIDLGKAQIVVTDPKGEMKIETVNGKKILTAKDPQGRLLFSGPIDTKEELEKVPAEVRERYNKVEQKDLPGVIATVSTTTDEDTDDGDDNDADNSADFNRDDEDDEGESSEPSIQQVSYRFGTLNQLPL